MNRKIAVWLWHGGLARKRVRSDRPSSYYQLTVPGDIGSCGRPEALPRNIACRTNQNSHSLS